MTELDGSAKMPPFQNNYFNLENKITMSEVRVRFAPSPTGYLHVGGLRTALFNYLFASSMGGKTILRIEDTDQNRKVEGAVENLISSLEWAGIEFDEGPHKGGAFGPYTQSERLDIYKQYCDQLVSEDKAYPCFCSSETLDEMRQGQQEKNLPIGYDGRCSHLPKDEVQSRIEAGEPHVIRMKIDKTKGSFSIEDRIRGHVQIPVDQVDDQVILKTDGFPTYHLASVVDDHHMNITHVIRGEEWLPSTPKHVQLYEHFGWNPPEFAHLPLLLNSDRSKLSKRQGDVATEDYKNKGFLKEALINFIALLGWNPGDDREIFSLDELKEIFSLERVGKSGAVFDMEKLQWMNQQYIKQLPLEELESRLEGFLSEEARNKLSKEQLSKVISILQDSLSVLPEINNKLDLFLNDSPEIQDSALIEITRGGICPESL